jgi:hypothetical protein
VTYADQGEEAGTTATSKGTAASKKRQPTAPQAKRQTTVPAKPPGRGSPKITAEEQDQVQTWVAQLHTIFDSTPVTSLTPNLVFYVEGILIGGKWSMFSGVHSADPLKSGAIKLGDKVTLPDATTGTCCGVAWVGGKRCQCNVFICYEKKNGKWEISMFAYKSLLPHNNKKLRTVSPWELITMVKRWQVYLPKTHKFVSQYKTDVEDPQPEVKPEVEAADEEGEEEEESPSPNNLNMVSSEL